MLAEFVTALRSLFVRIAVSLMKRSGRILNASRAALIPCDWLHLRPDALSYEMREGRNLALDTGGFESGHVVGTLFDGDDRPRITAAGEHHLHQESTDATVTIHVGVNIDKNEMP